MKGIKITGEKTDDGKKTLLLPVLIFLVFSVLMSACGTKSTLEVVSEALDIDVSSGIEVSAYDTHGGNGDGTACIVLKFSDDTVLEEIKNETGWIVFPPDETVKALVYGIEDETGRKGPFLTDEDGNPFVPEIQNGYYLLIDRQTENDKAAEADILCRSSLNFTLGVYDSDTNTLYFCQLDT